MRLTRRETEILNYVRSEAKVCERAGSQTYMSEDNRKRYRGMAMALNRLAGEILEGEHRQKMTKNRKHPVLWEETR